jgi:hypothetical protein
VNATIRFYTEEELEEYINLLRDLQKKFVKWFGVDDIFSNSKIYEIIIANELGHALIPGHSGSRDAKGSTGKEYEYKHFKQTSSNHSWTFNDYSDTTIDKLKLIDKVIFALINDSSFPPVLEWYIPIDGTQGSNYLKQRTEDLIKRRPRGHVNNRRMINISPMQLERDLDAQKVQVNKINMDGIYAELLAEIYDVSHGLEVLTGVKNILTSNKVWEVLVSVKLSHAVNPEQGGRLGAHDAVDQKGNTYEYKVSKASSWQFQDISDRVLEKYKNDKAIILATVDKQKLVVKNIYEAEPVKVINLLKQRRDDKEKRYMAEGREVRRLQISLSKSDLNQLDANTIYQV